MFKSLLLRWAALGCLFGVAGYVAAKDRLPPRWLTYGAVLGGLVLAVDRATYLPFLGETVLPNTVLLSTTPTFAFSDGYTVSKILKPPANATHVIYWAASRDGKSPGDAYAGFQNAGVEKIAGPSVRIRLPAPPGAYSIGKGALIKRHLHYRYAYPNGMLGPVHTKYI